MSWHWVTAYGVDGFRFDLAPALARGDHRLGRDGYDPNRPFLAYSRKSQWRFSVRNCVKTTVGSEARRLLQAAAPGVSFTILWVFPAARTAAPEPRRPPGRLFHVSLREQRRSLGTFGGSHDGLEQCKTVRRCATWPT